MRINHCKVLIDESKELLEISKKNYEKKFISTYDKIHFEPKVKSILEHCRSILEYTAQDIFENVISIEDRTIKLKKNKNVYFPYGKKKEDFLKSLKKNLPNLDKQDLRIYELIENLQDYKRQPFKKFLSYMCKITNHNKHNQLSESVRQSTKELSIGSYIKVDDSSSVTVENCIFDGVPSGNFKIENGEIKGAINPRLLSQVIIVENGSFVFKDSSNDVIEFLNLCIDEVENYVVNFYEILGRH
ncbi:hypothetical protein ACQCT5_10395 [Sutcliffiella halmapala]